MRKVGLKPGSPDYEYVQPTPRTYSYWELALMLIVVIVLSAVAVVAGLSIIFTSNRAGVKRYCMTEGTQGSVALNENDRTIRWYIQYPLAVDVPGNLYIRGPILPGATVADIYLSLCGYPSSLACDLSIPGVLQGIIHELNPGGTPLKPLIVQMNSEPSLYYVESNNITLGWLAIGC